MSRLDFKNAVEVDTKGSRGQGACGAEYKKACITMYFVNVVLTPFKQIGKAKAKKRRESGSELFVTVSRIKCYHLLTFSKNL